ncbi:MAG: phage portal protein [Clostridium sp.]|nr:phage portal protein [Clostridium sp.]
MYLWDKIRSWLGRSAGSEEAGGGLPDKALLAQEIAHWLGCPERLWQIKGHLYYNGEQDILNRQRLVIGEDGQLVPVANLPNNRVIDNQYAKMVNQKANYLLGQPFVLESENKQYLALLRQVFDKRFMRTLKNAGKAALNGGVAWLYPCYGAEGRLTFRLFPGYEVLPVWQDGEHNALSWAVRFYQVWDLTNGRRELQDRVEVYSLSGVQRYIWQNGALKRDKNALAQQSYVQLGRAGYNWRRLPLVPLKYNESESPLLRRVKSLQDGINVMLSDFENNMQEDARNTILVLKNYDGTNLGEFRRNLATYGAVKVRYDGETKGGVETLEISVNADNYQVILELFKKALIENAMGFDAKDDRLTGTPNQMNIQSMYSDIDLDANDMETELQAAFADLLWFANCHFFNTGQGDFFGEQVNVIFNRDMLMDESSIIANCAASVGILSDETIIGQHPWVDDVQQELERLAKQKQAEAAEYAPFAPSLPGGLNEE